MAKYQVKTGAWRGRRGSYPKPLSDVSIERMAPAIACYLMNESTGDGSPVYRDNQTGLLMVARETGVSAQIKQYAELFVAVQDILERFPQEESRVREMDYGNGDILGRLGYPNTQVGAQMAQQAGLRSPSIDAQAAGAGRGAVPEGGGVGKGTAFLNQLMPVVGGVAGAIYGGPRGAMAGYQAGQMAQEVAGAGLNYVQQNLPSLDPSFSEQLGETLEKYTK